MSTSSSKSQDARRSASSNKASEVASMASERIQHAGQHFVAEPAKDLIVRLKEFAQDKPDVAAMWCFGLGMLVGWKLRG